ncbi:unnamed protein product [Polarella glacialis]|uniref:Uncharacterized protein n=1 Tax=Polarella glacialis TaxID=89957 RepID=A0A813L279_POLGL|nr:unnamed protein product [Polarella glacialis]CAE8717877.1 unnamed protein product [Polarella glacialis]
MSEGSVAAVPPTLLGSVFKARLGSQQKVDDLEAGSEPKPRPATPSSGSGPGPQTIGHVEEGVCQLLEEGRLTDSEPEAGRKPPEPEKEELFWSKAQDALCDRQRREKLMKFLKANNFKDMNSSSGWFFNYRYPLHSAVQQNDAAMVSILLQCKAKSKLKDAHGLTARQLARRKNVQESHTAVLTAFANHAARRKARRAAREAGKAAAVSARGASEASGASGASGANAEAGASLIQNQPGDEAARGEVPPKEETEATATPQAVEGI